LKKLLFLFTIVSIRHIIIINAHIIPEFYEEDNGVVEKLGKPQYGGECPAQRPNIVTSIPITTLLFTDFWTGWRFCFRRLDI